MALVLVFLALMSASTVAAPPPELAIGSAGLKSFMKIQLVPKTTRNNEAISRLNKYIFIKKLGSGFFGESWMVRLRNGGADNFVMKKTKVNYSLFFFHCLCAIIHSFFFFFLSFSQKQVIGYSSFRLSGLREKYFGELLLEPSQEGRERIIRFVESFTHSDELYIVSLYGGMTLYQLMYETETGETAWKPSSWWKWLKETEPGREMMKKILFQLVSFHTPLIPLIKLAFSFILFLFDSIKMSQSAW
ncbi:uncharacterized protein LOC132279903 isoform X1 [Cornus florida]|uniref:uncharacterized protein LOC132279903 isoform X1 n=1 Tax=Cornus florida TaxID=4283 RepID=UPI00289F2A9F|nr:uncharacterized protein LOC132279903 isoform X1 [Cornus florida]